MENEIYKNMPVIIRQLLIITEGWLVGSSVENLQHGLHQGDFDVIVEDRELFMRGVQYLTAHRWKVISNTYGGLKFYDEAGPSLDIWSESLHHFLLNRSKNKDMSLFNLKKMVLIKTVC